MSINPQRFTISVEQRALDDLQARLALTRLPEKETVDDWDQGLPLAYARELLDYWRSDYDWRRCEAQLNRWPHFKAEIFGLDIHFIHVKSSRADARPLIMTHGWPGSVLEFANVIAALTEPEDATQPAFHLILPSLPGYGFSERPAAAGWSVEKIAQGWDVLMRGLGYERYFAQGGDWGAMVTSAIGAQNKGGCAAIHVNMAVAAPPPEVLANPTPFEAQSLMRAGWYQEKDSGYSKIQSTRPQTLGYALTDSPIGQMCWIIEKFHGWSDCNGHPENVFSRDHLIDNVMLYWLNATAASSARLYWHSFATGNLAEVPVPTGISAFPKELFRPSRRWAQARYKNIVYWNELEKGGHFAAMERPELFLAEVRNCFGAMTL